MKKHLAVFILVIVFGTLFCSPIMAKGPDYTYLKLVELTINQKAATINGVETTLDQPAFTKNGRTLVPFRFLAESLGAQVSWDSKTGTASLTLNDKEVKVPIGSKGAYVNGKITTLDVPAETKSGRTFIPLRFVSEALGASVDYDAETQTIKVILVDNTGWNTFDISDGGSFLYPSNWTLSGSLSSGLTIKSPVGTNISFSITDEEASDILDKRREEYTSQGFQFLTEEPIDYSDYSAGSAVVFTKIDFQDVNNSDVKLTVAGNDGDQTFIMDVTTKLPNLDGDMAVIEKMFEEN